MKNIHHIKTISLILLAILFSCLMLGCNSDKPDK